MTFWKRIAILCCVTFFVYFPSFFNPFIWDDEQFIYNNTYVKNFDVISIFTKNTIAGAGEQSNYFRPLTTFSFAFDYAIWGSQPFGFHLINTLIHIGVGLLLCIFLRELNLSKKVTLFVTAIFLLHPTQTEAVTYINSRGDSLYSFFLFSSLISFLYILKNKIINMQLYDLKITFGKSFWYFLCVISFISSILSKELGIAGLGLFILTALFFRDTHAVSVNFNFLQKKYRQKHLLVFVTLISVILLYGMARLTIWSFPSGYEVDLDASEYHANILLRFFTAFKIYWLYIGILLFPFPLHMERTTETVMTIFNPWTFVTVLLFISLYFISKQEKKLFNTQWSLFGFLWFSGLFIPISGLVPSVGMIYEHWMYLPLIGFFICIIQCFRLTSLYVILHKVWFYILVIIIFLFSCATMYQNYLWGDLIRFYSYTLKFNQTARLHNNLAKAYADTNQIDPAIDQYKKAIAIGDYYPQTHHNLANSYVAKKEYDNAVAEYARAIEINRYFYPAHFQQITILVETKKYDLALEKSRELLALDINDVDLNLLHGYTLLLNNKNDEAETYFTKALSLSQDPQLTQNAIENLKLRTNQQS